jgi:FAD/FMN-containing dehydrogenase
LISMTSGEMLKVYPALTQFQEIRRQLDPQNMFYTQRLAKLFG